MGSRAFVCAMLALAVSAAIAQEASVPAPAPPESRAQQVRGLIEKDQWREALDAARQAVATSPSDTDAATALGEALYRSGRIDEAGVVLEKAVAAGGESPLPRALVALGLIRLAEGRVDEAGTLIDKAVDRAPNDRYVAYHAAEVAASRAESTRRLERYLELSQGDDPDRVEGARSTIRVNKALGDRQVWVPVAAPEREEIPLRAVGRPGEGTTGFVVEAGLSNGKKVKLLLDTGAGGVFVLQRAVKKAGAHPLAEETVFAGGGEGRTTSRREIVPEFAVGGLRWSDALVTTTTQELDPEGRFLGVLGLSVFSGYKVTLDLVNRRLVLERGGSSAGDAAAKYWSVGGQLLVEAGSGDVRGLFLLDTGATRSFLAASFAESVPGAQVGPPADVRTYGGSVGGARTVRGLALTFQSLPPNAKPKNAGDLTQRSRLSGVEVSGFLGLDVLDDAVLEIDTVARRVRAFVPGKK